MRSIIQGTYPTIHCFSFLNKTSNSLTLQERYWAQRHKLAKLDPHWNLDFKLTEHLAGSGGAERLQNRFLSACLPMASTARTIEECSAAAADLRKSELYQFASTDAQGELNAACTLLNDLALQRLPPRSESPSDFMRNVWLQLPLFVEYTDEGAEADAPEEGDVKQEDGGKGEPVVYRGRAALTRILSDVRAKSAETQCLDDFRFLAPFSYLLAQEDREFVSQRLITIMKTAPVKGHGGPTGHARRIPQKRKASETAMVEDAAAACLGI
eukprot:6458906-Amphidinium_carterae.4